jgi:hypothetical protein
VSCGVRTKMTAAIAMRQAVRIAANHEPLLRGDRGGPGGVNAGSSVNTGAAVADCVECSGAESPTEP